MNKLRVVKVKEVMGFSPTELGGAFVSRLLIESEGVGSSKLMVNHATLKPGKSPGGGSAHPIPYDEAYYILRGHGTMEFNGGEESYEVEPDSAIFIPGGTMHKLTNTGTEDLEFLSIWPLAPTEEGVNSVFDERKRAWGKSFRRVEESSEP